ncbi:MAG: hypothetical protein ACOC0P_05760, partial [Planctomycetota bacterium]
MLMISETFKDPFRCRALHRSNGVNEVDTGADGADVVHAPATVEKLDAKLPLSRCSSKGRVTQPCFNNCASPRTIPGCAVARPNVTTVIVNQHDGSR